MRLVLMARFGMDLPTNLIEEQIATAIDLIVVTRRLADGARIVASLTDVSRGPGGVVQLNECVSFDLASHSWTLVSEPSFVAAALEDGLLDTREVESWRALFP